MIQELIEQHLGASQGTRGNDNAYYCPKCNWKNPRLMVNYTDDVFHCWYCGWGGKSNIGILYHFGVDKSIINDVRRELGIYEEYVSKSGNSQSPEYSILDRVKSKLYLNDIDERSHKIHYLGKEYIELYPNRAKYKSIYSYLRSRGLSQREIRMYNIFVDTEHKDTFLMPSYVSTGKINYYIRKKINGSYINLEDSKFESIFFDSYIDFKGDIILVEGGFDATKVGYNTIPLLGTILSDTLKDRIINEKPKSVSVFLDKDALYKSFNIALDLYNNGVNTYIIHTNNYDDPNKIPRTEMVNILEKRKNINLKFILECKSTDNMYEMF